MLVLTTQPVKPHRDDGCETVRRLDAIDQFEQRQRSKSHSLMAQRVCRAHQRIKGRSSRSRSAG